MKNTEKLILIGPGDSINSLSPTDIDAPTLTFSGTLDWFYENNIYPSYWCFIDPTTVMSLLDKYENPLEADEFGYTHKKRKKWLKGLKENTVLLYNHFQGKEEFYDKGLTTTKGKKWLINHFGKTVFPYFKSLFKDTVSIPTVITSEDYTSLLSYKNHYPYCPLIKHGRVGFSSSQNTDKFTSYVLPLSVFYFKNLKNIKCIGFGDYNKPRAYSTNKNNPKGNSHGYEGFIKSYKILYPLIHEVLIKNRIKINFTNRNSHYLNLENSQTMEKITFCIPSKSNLRYLKTCVPSIRENAARKDHDIIIFVDSDEDGTIEWLKEVKDEYNLQYYVNPKLGKELYGIGRAYDFCIEKSTTDIFMIFHADMMLGKNADLNVYEHLKPKTVVCSTRIEPPIHPNAGEKILINFGMWPEEFNKDEFYKYVTEHLEDTKTTEGIFAPWMMYKKEFLALGGHDPRMHSCREDSDIFNRMYLDGFKFIQPWNSLVYHLTGRGAGSFDGDKERHEQWKKDMNASTLEFIRKWGQNVNHTSLMKPVVYPVYKKSVIINNPTPELEAVLEPWFNGGKDIIVEVDSKMFNQQDWHYIQQLPAIIQDSGEIGTFNLGNLKITINSLNTYEKDLIICKK